MGYNYGRRRPMTEGETSARQRREAKRVSLKTELTYFEQHRAEWLEHYAGKFALIRGTQVGGMYDSLEGAYTAGVGLWGNVPFLIKQILREDLIEESPALMYGLLNAHT